jgi:hypothetical protein
LATTYLHDHPEFSNLLRILAEEMKIQPGLIEKDYWIMHALYGLKKLGLDFELKGGTSLSKGFKIIDRFSEDIDIHIHAPIEFEVKEDLNGKKDQHATERKRLYDWLAINIQIDGIVRIIRDTDFDNKIYTSGGIRLFYNNEFEVVDGFKANILLEAGFDTVSPNRMLDISSWAYEKAAQTRGIDIIDNRAMSIKCYLPEYTFVEKLQTIIRKFRQIDDKGIQPNLMRQYYDIYSLLGEKEVQQFIGTPDYLDHKNARIKGKDAEVEIVKNEAFLLKDPELKKSFREKYNKTSALYYNGQPYFEDLLKRIQEWLPKL